MFLLYLDEFGHAGAWDPSDPRHAHHPLFGLAGLAVDGARWRDVDRGYLRLKEQFYAAEIERKRTLEGLRAERYEPKRMRSRRDRRFAVAVLEMIRDAGGTLFAYGCVKHQPPSEHSEPALYHSCVRGALLQFEKFLRQKGRHYGRGIVILDRRNEDQNEKVLSGAQGVLFSHPHLRGPNTRILETPLLIPSEWYHGAQAADTVGRAIGALYRWRVLKEPKFSWAEEAVGGLIDSLAYNISPWSTVFVRRT